MQQLTGRAQVNKQQEWLEAQGIAHRRDGARLIVSRHHVRRWLEGEEQPVRGEICWNVPGMAGYDPSKPPNWDPSTRAKRK